MIAMTMHHSDRSSCLTAWFVTAALALPTAISAQGEDPAPPDPRTATEKIESTRSTLSEWIEIRRSISKEKADWAVGRDIVTQRIDLVREQIESLNSKTEETRQGVAKTDEKKARLTDELAEITSTESGFRDKLVPLEVRVKKLIERLPSPILDTIGPLSQQLPIDPRNSERPIGERLRCVLGILNEVNRFQNEITSTTEIRDLGNGETSEVDVLYLGISQAYYVNGKGDAAGIGRAAEDAWQWKPANGYAPAIRKAIAIFRDKEKADFVRLPIRID